jgi:hypothetical protein
MNLPSKRLVASLSCALVLTVGSACHSTDTKSNSVTPEKDIQPIGEIVESTKKPVSIGMLLTDLNSSIKAWNNLNLAGQSSKDQARARDIELHIQTVAHQRRAEITAELESGPLNNRIVAAAALGFTRNPEALGPLLAALDDSHPEVTSSALIGLWLLQRPDIPLEKICPFFSPDSSDDVRSNAALLIAWLTEQGAKSDCELPRARMGILDPSPSVRTHSAMIMANRLDADSVQALADRLDDETLLVCGASTRAIAYIGKNVPQARGPAARALVKAWIATTDEKRKDVIFRGLVELAQSNYGSNEEEWINWAQRLP